MAALFDRYSEIKRTLIARFGELGEPILPTGMIPLTSMVTLLRYGEEPGAEIFFENGDKRPIPLGDLPQFVTEN